MKKEFNQEVYIQSIQASQVWEHMYRERQVKSDYVGMIPYSLELIKLKKVIKHVNKRLNDDKLNILHIKENKKPITDAVINLKFDSKVRSGEEILDTMYKNLSKMDSDKVESYQSKINQLQKIIKTNRDCWRGINNNQLREIIYKDGFTIKTVDKDTGEVHETHYKAYKRSSSKSRTGQCLMIHEALYNDMIKWSRMGIEFDKSKKIDFASLLAYESLVGSSIQDTVTINPNNILIVDDLFSSFKVHANVIKKDHNTNFLNSFHDDVELSNNIFDGESLLDTKYFKGEYSKSGMLLLRNHIFKSAAFNTNIQLFYKEYADNHGIDYDKWYVKDMFGNEIKVTDIHLITTPSSLKALKFAVNEFGEAGKDYTDRQINKLQKKMFHHWKSVVRKDKNQFGICKSEKASKYNTNDKILQQMSYQMLNSIPFTYEQVKELASHEINYIRELKDDDNTFIDYLDDNKNDINSNQMMIDLYRKNPGITATKLFRDFRKKSINKYVAHT